MDCRRTSFAPLLQTSDGFLWVGTMNGLVRFDGVRFRGFSTDGPAELQENISGLAPDAMDGLWIATARGLFHYRDHEFRSIKIGNEQHQRIDAMARGQDGEVWIYANSQLFRTHGDMVQARLLPSKAGAVRDFAEDTGHALWIADGAQVFALRDHGATESYQLPGARIVYADDFGNVFAGDGHRLYRFDGRGFVRVNDPGLGNFVNVMVDHQRRLWMASGGLHGVSRKSGDTKETLTAADGLASDDVRVIFEDRSHDIWLKQHLGLTTIASRCLHHLHRERWAGRRTQSGGHCLSAEERDDLGRNVKQWHRKDGGNGRWRQYGVGDGLPAGQVRGFCRGWPAARDCDLGLRYFRRAIHEDWDKTFCTASLGPAGNISARPSGLRMAVSGLAIAASEDCSAWRTKNSGNLARRRELLTTRSGRSRRMVTARSGPVQEINCCAGPALDLRVCLQCQGRYIA